jgi:AraC-like DNA-binding protein/mannose-6-phosphate isomerase-like protein (cupin superfamily)
MVKNWGACGSIAPPTTVDLISISLRSFVGPGPPDPASGSLFQRRSTRYRYSDKKPLWNDVQRPNGCFMTPATAIHPELLAAPSGDYPQRIVAYVLDIKRGGGLPPHSHRRAQLLAVTSGSIAVTAEGASFVAPPERAVWVPANTVHETRHLTSTRLQTLYVATDGAPELSRRTTVVHIGPLLRELMNVIVARPRLHDEDGADGRLVSVLLDQLATAAELPLNLPMPKSPDLLSIATDLLEAPTSVPSVSHLADSMRRSPRTLQRRFKSETGLSLRSFRRQAKLLRSLELLSSDMSIGAVSDHLGFGEPSAFIAMFRSAFGVTPGRYLARKRSIWLAASYLPRPRSH